MTTRLPSLHGRITTFASHSAELSPSADDAEGIGWNRPIVVDGLMVTAQVTRDDVAVAWDSDRIRSGLRSRRIADVDAANLPAGIVPLAAVLGRPASGEPTLITVDGELLFTAVLTTARDLGPDVEERLWLVSPDRGDLVSWRPRSSARLFHSTSRGRAGSGLEKLFAAVHADELDGVAMPHRDWTGGRIALAHRFELLALATGARHNREMATVIDAGIDAITSDDPARLAAVAAEYYR